MKEEEIEKSKLFKVQKAKIQVDPSLVKKCHESQQQIDPIYIYCSKDNKVMIGRGPDVTIKIGKRNKKVSREHVMIEYKSDLNFFELTVLSPNGVLVDHIAFMKGEHIPVLEDTLIEIVGYRLVFKEQVILDDHKQHSPTMIPPLQVPLQKSLKTMSLEDEIIQILAYTRKSTMTCTDISKRLLNDNSILSVSKILNNSNMIGCIKRLGKTADGSPKENLYYYKADMDMDPERKKKYMDVGRSARKCTMKDTQYFFKIPPKLPNHNKVKKKVNHKSIEEEVSIASSDDDISDMEVFELFKDI